MNLSFLTSLIILTLLGFSFGLKSDALKPIHCEEIIKQFIRFNLNFTSCFGEYLNPIRFCQSCSEFYSELDFNYNKAHRDLDCKQRFFDNRFNILGRLYMNSKNIWDEAFCPGCKDSETQFVEESIKNVSDCIKHNKKQCINCKNEYDKANALYNTLSRKYDAKVCFDIQDMMNETRITWSKTLKCNKRTANLDAFTTTAASIAFIPVMFYFGLFIYLKRRRSNYETLTTDFENHNNHQRNMPGILEEEEEHQTTQIPCDSNYNEPQPSTSKSNLKQNDFVTKISKTKNKRRYRKSSYKKLNLPTTTDDDYDDDDDSMLPVQTDNNDDESMLNLRTDDDNDDKRPLLFTDSEDKTKETESNTRVVKRDSKLISF